MANEIMEVVVSGHLAGQLVQNVFHFRCQNTAGASPFSYAKNLNDSLIIASQFLGLYCFCLPEDYIGSSTRIRMIHPVPGPTYYSGAAAWEDGNVGLRPGQISSAQVCPLIIWVPTTLPTKTGRTFLPGVSEDDIDEMIFTSGLQTNLADFMANYISLITMPDIDYEGCIWRRDTSVADVITGAYVSPHIGTQRRRLTPV